MKTGGARRKKASQSPPGSAHAAVSQPPPCSRPSFANQSASSRGSACWSSSASSTSSRIRSCLCAGSGSEELGILFPPGDPDRLAFAPAEGGVALARHLGEHPLAADRQVELHQVAEELDEEDLALRRVRPARGAVGDLHRRGPDR